VEERGRGVHVASPPVAGTSTLCRSPASFWPLRRIGSSRCGRCCSASRQPLDRAARRPGAGPGAGRRGTRPPSGGRGARSAAARRARAGARGGSGRVRSRRGPRGRGRPMLSGIAGSGRGCPSCGRRGGRSPASTTCASVRPGARPSTPLVAHCLAPSSPIIGVARAADQCLARASLRRSDLLVGTALDTSMQTDCRLDTLSGARPYMVLSDRIDAATRDQAWAGREVRMFGSARGSCARL